MGERLHSLRQDRQAGSRQQTKAPGSRQETEDRRGYEDQEIVHVIGVHPYPERALQATPDVLTLSLIGARG
jgi:hypothetical protein